MMAEMQITSHERSMKGKWKAKKIENLDTIVIDFHEKLIPFYRQVLNDAEKREFQIWYFELTPNLRELLIELVEPVKKQAFFEWVSETKKATLLQFLTSLVASTMLVPQQK